MGPPSHDEQASLLDALSQLGCVGVVWDPALGAHGTYQRHGAPAVDIGLAVDHREVTGGEVIEFSTSIESLEAGGDGAVVKRFGFRLPSEFSQGLAEALESLADVTGTAPGFATDLRWRDFLGLAGQAERLLTTSIHHTLYDPAALQRFRTVYREDLERLVRWRDGVLAAQIKPSLAEVEAQIADARAVLKHWRDPPRS
jgi:hypothetical protein